MKILLKSWHSYPARDTGVGTGRAVRELPSGSAQNLHDLLALGLAERGHEVYYLLEGCDAPLPKGVHYVQEPLPGMDIYHNYEPTDAPWVASQHFKVKTDRVPPNLIYVSEAMARFYHSDRFVHNGLHPDHYLFQAQKEDYFLYLSSMGRRQAVYEEKGLPLALRLAKEKDIRLIVAGSSALPAVVQEVERLCQEYGAEYVGDVRGATKARLYAGAKALLFPVQRLEPFGLVIVEALLSGTPVIGSTFGACPEIIDPDIGFVCADWEEYTAAVDRIDTIDPFTCRARAVARFHYRVMVDNYLREYEKEIAAFHARRGAVTAG